MAGSIRAPLQRAKRRLANGVQSARGTFERRCYIRSFTNDLPDIRYEQRDPATPDTPGSL